MSAKNGKHIITPEEMRETFDYCYTTGLIKFKPSRPRDHFPSNHSFVIWHKRYAGKELTVIDRHGYIKIRTRIHGVMQNLTGHRVAFVCMMGRWPTDMLDHKNTVKSDNRWENLRECSRGENTMNRGLPSSNTTGIKNVCKTSGGFKVSIRANGIKHEKRFLCIDEAGEWARQKREEVHGEFARHHTQPTESGASEPACCDRFPKCVCHEGADGL